MIRHIVLFRIKEDLENRDEETDIFIEALRQLKTKIPSIIDIEVGKNIHSNEMAHDVCLITTFKNSAGVDAYIEHTAYQEIKEHLLSVTTDRTFIDYEVA